MSILNFPLEVTTNIFANLHWTDLLRVTATCKAFHELLLSSAQLRYKVELGCAGLEDSCGCPACVALSFAEREGQLLGLTNAWTSATMQSHVTIRLPETDMTRYVYWLHGGVFACSSTQPTNVPEAVASSKSVLEIVQLPSVLHNRQWSKIQHNLDFAVQDFAFNAHHDVVALLEGPQEQQHADGETSDLLLMTIHLKTLFDMIDHPYVARPTITYDLPRSLTSPIGTWTVSYVQFSGDILGALFEFETLTHVTGGTRVVFWNWRMGVIVGELLSHAETGFFDSFSLLSRDLFVVANSRARRISVYTLSEPGPCPSFLLSFGLPELSPSKVYLRIDCTYMNCSETQSLNNVKNSRPFRVASDAGTITFVLEIGDRSDGGWREMMIYLVTPVSTFLSGGWCHSGLRYVHWDNWGPKLSRVLPCLSLQPNPVITFGSGNRIALFGAPYLHPTPFPLQESRTISIFDFNQPELRRTQQTLDESNSGPNSSERNSNQKRVINWLPSTLREKTLFKADVTTQLPYRRRDVIVRGYYRSLMMDEENILLFAPGSDGIETLTVVHIGYPSTEVSKDPLWVEAPTPSIRSPSS